MKIQYLIRLDDACEKMDVQRWRRMEDLLDKYSVKPMVGIIPHCEDEMMAQYPEDAAFWAKAQAWVDKGWTIALHGYNHVYSSTCAGINPLWNRSEFAGLPLDEQKEKIRFGVAIMKDHGIKPKFFFAPSHTFDENTLVALKEESDIRMISDTIALKPYRRSDFIFLPQIGGHCVKMPLPGVYTFCFHPNTMDDKAFAALESFLKAHRSEFIGFEDIDLTKVRKKDLMSKMVEWGYFMMRKIKGMR